jgi:hypothetical protein
MQLNKDNHSFEILKFIFVAYNSLYQSTGLAGGFPLFKSGTITAV